MKIAIVGLSLVVGFGAMYAAIPAPRNVTDVEIKAAQQDYNKRKGELGSVKGGAQKDLARKRIDDAYNRWQGLIKEQRDYQAAQSAGALAAKAAELAAQKAEADRLEAVRLGLVATTGDLETKLNAEQEKSGKVAEGLRAVTAAAVAETRRLMEAQSALAEAKKAALDQQAAIDKLRQEAAAREQKIAQLGVTYQQARDDFASAKTEQKEAARKQMEAAQQQWQKERDALEAANKRALDQAAAQATRLDAELKTTTAQFSAIRTLSLAQRKEITEKREALEKAQRDYAAQLQAQQTAAEKQAKDLQDQLAVTSDRVAQAEKAANELKMASAEEQKEAAQELASARAANAEIQRSAADERSKLARLANEKQTQLSQQIVSLTAQVTAATQQGDTKASALRAQLVQAQNALLEGRAAAEQQVAAAKKLADEAMQKQQDEAKKLAQALANQLDEANKKVAAAEDKATKAETGTAAVQAYADQEVKLAQAEQIRIQQELTQKRLQLQQLAQQKEVEAKTYATQLAAQKKAAEDNSQDAKRLTAQLREAQAAVAKAQTEAKQAQEAAAKEREIKPAKRKGAKKKASKEESKASVQPSAQVDVDYATKEAALRIQYATNTTRLNEELAKLKAAHDKTEKALEERLLKEKADHEKAMKAAEDNARTAQEKAHLKAANTAVSSVLKGTASYDGLVSDGADQSTYPLHLGLAYLEPSWLLLDIGTVSTWPQIDSLWGRRTISKDIVNEKYLDKTALDWAESRRDKATKELAPLTGIDRVNKQLEVNQWKLVCTRVSSEAGGKTSKQLADEKKAAAQ